MKFLLIASMLLGSAFANANDGWDIKCFEKDGHEWDLEYIIKVWHNGGGTTGVNPAMAGMMAVDLNMGLLDCSRSRGGDPSATGCRERGYLKKVERQEETCLVLARHGGDNVTNGYWSLCREEQDTLVDSRFVPVTVTDDRQESRLYCEKSLLRILR